jgi:4-hydroxy-tetrahydrodipicolinate synthase
MTSATWAGIIVALWSPIDEAGRPRVQDLTQNLEFVRQAGVRGALALGSTGEFLYLDSTQRKQLLEEIIGKAQNLKVIANISDLNPRVVADLGQFARAAGADAVALLPPHFYPFAQTDLVEFFVRAGEEADLPVFLYNFPERTGNRISLETIASVADRVRLAGVKQSGGEFEYHRALVELGREKNFVVFTGADTRLGEALSLGVAGCVSGLANAVPELIVEMYDAFEGHDLKKGALCSERLRVLGGLVERLEFPLNVRACMEARGLPVGAAKSIISPHTQLRYHQLTRDLRLLFQQWDLI